MKTMEKLIIAMSVLAIISLGSCQTEAGKKATEERIKAEKKLDSIKKVNKKLLPYLDCTMKLMLAGASDEEACEKCKEIHPKGFYYDSINSLIDTSKTK